MSNLRTMARLIGGCVVAGLVVLATGSLDDEAQAAKRRKRSRRGGPLTVESINVADASGVPANQVIEVVFSQNIKASTINYSVLQVREENATGTGFTKQIFGDFQITGNIVRFFPRLPTNLRDPADPEAGFYPEGSILDDAAENAGLKPDRNYQITIRGRPFVSPIRSQRGRPLKREFQTQFTVSDGSASDELYTTTTYGDAPPPQFSFSNPVDLTPTTADQYTHSGGAIDVPNDLALSLFLTRVPLAPQLLRVLGNMELKLISRKGDRSNQRPVDGSVFVEQNFSTTLLVFQPRFPLADQGTYALRATKDVKDLTEQFDFAPNRNRARLRGIYDWLASARTQSPSTPWDMLPDPEPNLIPDWPPLTEPGAAVTRGIYKTNILTLGDAKPEEFDPRTMVIFSTRDEPVSNASLRLEFLDAEGAFDAKLSTAEWDDSVPGAASAILTIAGGSAADGDYRPAGNETLSASDFGGVMNFRDVVIPAGVTVTFSGDEPLQLRAINFQLDGTISVSGSIGAKAATANNRSASAIVEARGGSGGPGGGAGADGGDVYKKTSSSSTVGPQANKGGRGKDSEGTEDSDAGGDGGLGGRMSTGTYYCYGGGGGGGGAKDQGNNGQAGAGYYPSWNGAGGAGGAGSTNDELDPLVGGAGGGSGGNGASSYPYWTTWNRGGSGGGGGGGAINIQVARRMNIGQSGQVEAQGGPGGPISVGSYGPGGPGGGGGGGSILARSGQGFNLADPANAFNVSGGPGGLGQAGTYTSYRGGDGGDGYVRLEDPNGGLQVPGSTAGLFDPIGGGVPSFVYSTWLDLGVQDPRILNLSNDLIGTDPAGNDAIFVEVQLTIEDASVFGEPNTSAVDTANQDSLDESVTSQWMPLKIHDLTGLPGGAFFIPGYDPGLQGLEYTFPIADTVNSRGFRFVRYRVTFQLDEKHFRLAPLPSIDFIEMIFQFNF